jgi:hypothetical protein
MLGLDVSNVVRDPEREVTWEILTYRKLAREEDVCAVRYAFAKMKKCDTPKPGCASL